MKAIAITTGVRPMRKLLIGGLALTAAAVLLASPALAADMAVKAPPPAPPPAYDWTGFYIGGDVGAAWTSNNATWTPLPLGPFVFPFTNFGINAISGGNGGSGFLGGLHAGYDWQFAPTWVAGLEGDWSWTRAGGAFTQPWTVFGTGAPSAAGDITSMSSTLDWLASIRGRFGFLVLPNVLIYGTGGAAWAKIDYSASAINGGGGFTYTPSASFSSTLPGYAVGGGLEWAMTRQWQVRAEYLFYGFGSQGVLVSSVNFPGKPSSFAWSNTSVNVARLGLSYKF
jgi:outer membrane immunogenic protein